MTCPNKVKWCGKHISQWPDTGSFSMGSGMHVYCTDACRDRAEPGAAKMWERIDAEEKAREGKR